MGRGLDKCYPDLGENPREIQGLAISPNTVVYYYTYGSVLAALSRPRDNKCGEAMQVLGEVRAELIAHPEAYEEGYQTILSIVQAGEAICEDLGAPTSSVLGGTGEMTATPGP